jgi:RHS repeat-associated protein
LSGFTGTGSTGATLNFTGSVLQCTGNMGGIITNTGTLTIAGFDPQFSGVLTNIGTIAVATNNQFIANATGTTINNESGATFDLQPGAWLNANGQITIAFDNYGTLERSTGSGIATVSFPVYDVGGTIEGNSGTLILNGGGSGSSNATVTAAFNATVTLTGNYSGSFAGSGSGAVQLSGFTGTGSTGATVNFTGSVLQCTGNLGGTITNTGTLTIAGFDPQFSGVLTNTGTIAVATNNQFIANATGATINNESGATFDLQPGAWLNANGQTNIAFNNYGTLEQSTGTGIATVSFPVNEIGGTIAGNSGTLILNGGGSGTSNATVTAATGGTVILTGNYSGTFAGSGSGAVQLSGFAGAGSTGVTLSFTGSVLQWTGNLGGTVTNAGTLVISAPYPHLTGTLTNTGTIAVTASTQIIANASGATINNQSGATFDFRAGAWLNVNSQSNTAFNNDGTLLVSASLATTDVGFAFGGSGTVKVSSGTIAIDSGTLGFGGSQVLVLVPSALLKLGGNLAGSTQNADQFAPEGTVLLNGPGTLAAPQLVEVLSRDLGNIPAGFKNNFGYGTLALGNGTYARLVDNAKNSSGTGKEALYVNALVVPGGCTLDLNGFHVYARQMQIGGTIAGGTVSQLPAAGPLILNSPAPGLISQAGQVDDWTFYGQAGQTVAIVVNTGTSGSLDPLQPTLNYAQVQVLDPSGHVVASGTNTQAGVDVAVTGIALAASGTYTVRVQAPPSQPGSTGNYLVTERDANIHNYALTFDETASGQVNSPYSADHWNFSAVANEQVQFNLVSSSSSALEFDLTGPSGVTIFTGQTTSSGLVTLPVPGNYVLTARLATDQPGAYAFNLALTPQANLTPGTPYKDVLTGSGQAQVFTVTLANPAALSVIVTDPNANDQNEVYVSAGKGPTRDAFQFRSSGTGPNQTVALAAQPGTYYILVYNNLVTSPGSHYTIEVQAPPFAWTGFAPGKIGSSQPATLLATGVFPLAYQSATAYQIQFVSAGGNTYPASPLYLAPTSLGFQPNASLAATNTSPSLSATLPANTLPAGTYSVRITDSLGNSQTMPAALAVTAGGTGILSTKLLVPDPVGYHQPSILYVQYSNTGTAPLAAPLLVLTATQKGQQGAFLSLDSSLAGLGYVSDNTPAGFSPTVQFVANGSIPGVLEPGESVTLPVYYAGWLHTEWDFSRPPIEFTLGELDTTNTTAIDWSSYAAGLRPSTINQAAWNVIAPILTANLGSTWGQYLQTLNNDVFYLASIGQPTTDLNELLAFEIEKANAIYSTRMLDSVTAADLPGPGMDLVFQQSYQQSISGRYTEGILGFGWTTNWDISAATMPNGDVRIENDGTSQYFSLQPDRSFLAQSNDQGVTLSMSSGAYLVTEPDGASYRFNPNGTLKYLEDVHGNKITAGYSAQNQLVTLTDSNGEYLDLTYNSKGLLATLADSTGQAETYAYDSSGHLVSYTDRYGTTTYSYKSGASPAQNNALSEIAYADNTHVDFGYDSDGRLIDEHRDGGQEDVAWTYLNPGGYVTTDALGNQDTAYFNVYGAPAETIDPLGNIHYYWYDSNLNLTKAVGPGGVTATFRYDSDGNLTSATDPLGLTTTFTHDAAHNLTSSTDAKGNTTRYAYDSQNNLLSITYADGTQRQDSYNPLGEATEYISASSQAIGYTYNALGLLTKASFADGTSFSYTYNTRGAMTGATDQQGNVTTFVYADARNPDLLTEVEYPDGTFLKFRYNVVGQRTQSVDQTGFTITYLYDALGRLSELADGSGIRIVQYSYDAAGSLIQKDMGNGTRSVYTYDGDGDLLSITNLAPDHVTVNSFDDYTCDAFGNVLTDTSQDGEWIYTYDADSELTHAVFTPNGTDPDGLSAQNIQYVYDAAGNRVSETTNGVTTTYVVNNVNEYTSSTTSGLTTNDQYDANGNLIARIKPGGTTTYTYNPIGELTSQNGPGVAASYKYDAIGNRISQTVQGVTTNFEIDPAGLGDAVAAYSGSGTLLDHYTYGIALVSQVSASGAASYYDLNNIGSVIGVTSASGTYINQYTYLPFGGTTTVKAAVSNPFTYVGGLGAQDDRTGLLFMATRYYDVATGQFTSNDPLGLAGGDINIRRYVGNDATSAVDPSGEDEGVLRGTWNSIKYLMFGPDKRYHYVRWIPDPKNPKEYLSEPESIFVEEGEPVPDGFTKCGMDDSLDDFNAVHSGPPQLGVERFRIIRIPEPYPDASPAQPSPSPSASPSSGGDALNSASGADAGANDCIICNILATIRSIVLPTLPTSVSTTTTTVAVASHDPNSLIGPAGYGNSNFVAAGTLLPYQILFENDPGATAPAQRVDITDQLDPNLDWSTLQLAAAGFGSTAIAIPPGLQHYATTVSVTENGQTFEVIVNLNLDPVTGILTISFQSIAPATNLPPASLLTGFLPPEDGTGRGIGFVSFTIRPKSNLATGTPIRNVASIIFDRGELITTDQVDDHDASKGIDPAKQALVTIDATEPTSSVNPLAATTSSTSFPVSWSGSDGSGSGIAAYSVFVSDNGGAFAPFLTRTTATSATFTGQVGHTYGFYSVATSNVGLVQPAPAVAQVTTRVTAIAGPPTSTVSPLPATTTNPSFTLSWSGSPGPGATSITSYEIFVSTDGGAFTPFLTHTTATSATFTGQFGHTYGFYSVATDNLGNIQPAPQTAQASTAVLSPSVPPKIVGETVLFRRKTNKKGKPVGSPVLTGFDLDFSAPLDPATATNPAFYQLVTVTTKHIKKKIKRILHPISGFTVSYSAAKNSVDLTLLGKQTFPTGGQLTIVSGPSAGVKGASGAPLGGPTIFAISVKGRTITATTP